MEHLWLACGYDIIETASLYCFTQIVTNPRWDAIINKPDLATTTFVNNAITNAITDFATEGFVGNAITTATTNLETSSTYQ